MDDDYDADGGACNCRTIVYVVPETCVGMSGIVVPAGAIVTRAPGDGSGGDASDNTVRRNQDSFPKETQTYSRIYGLVGETAVSVAKTMVVYSSLAFAMLSGTAVSIGRLTKVVLSSLGPIGISLVSCTLCLIAFVSMTILILNRFKIIEDDDDADGDVRGRTTQRHVE